jgi:hypothetical protein
MVSRPTVNVYSIVQKPQAKPVPPTPPRPPRFRLPLPSNNLSNIVEPETSNVPNFLKRNNNKFATVKRGKTKNNNRRGRSTRRRR